MSVSPILGEVLRYRVTSDSNPKHSYICDLSENQGSGACFCKDFQTRRGPAIKAGMPPFSREVSCKHLIAARTYFCHTTLKEMARRIATNWNDPTD